MSKINRQERLTVVDVNTGEIVQEMLKTVTFKTADKEEFFMLFIKSLAPLFRISSLPAIKILIKFCQIASYNTGEIVLSSSKRKDICEELEMTNNHFSNMITYLKKQGILYGQHGSFYLNPIISWKGDTNTREESIKKMELHFKLQYENNKFD